MVPLGLVTHRLIVHGSCNPPEIVQEVMNHSRQMDAFLLDLKQTCKALHNPLFPGSAKDIKRSSPSTL